MLNARELDSSKFPIVVVNTIDFHHFKKLQRIKIPASRAMEKLMDRIENNLNPAVRRKSEMTDEEILKAIMYTVAKEGDVTIEKIKTKVHQYAIYRQIIIFITRLCTGYDVNALGRIFEQDHSTSIHSSKKIFQLLSVHDKKVSPICRQVFSAIQERYKITPDYSKQWYTDLRDGVERRRKPISMKEKKEIIELSKTLSCGVIAENV